MKTEVRDQVVPVNTVDIHNNNDVSHNGDGMQVDDDGLRKVETNGAPNKADETVSTEDMDIEDNLIAGMDFENYGNSSKFSQLNSNREVLFGRHVEGGRTQWLSGEEYKKILKDENRGDPTVEDMDLVPSIIRNERGNYFPKSSLSFNLGLSGDPSMQAKNMAASEILARNGLSGRTYSRVRKFGKSWDVPLDQRVKETPTGPRPQQREYVYPQHAGVENRSYLLIKDGNVESFDIAPDSKQARMDVADLQRELGGVLLLKSSKSNGYHSVDYLNEKGGKGAAQDRHGSLMGIGRNTNSELPEVAVLIEGGLVDIRLVQGNAEKNPKLVADLARGAREVAHRVRVRSPNGGYWTPEFACKTDKKHFEQVMDRAGIDKCLGEHRFTPEDRDKQREAVPVVLVQTSKRVLEDGKNLISSLPEGKSIASHYKANEIFVTKQSNSSVLPTEFYTQLHEAKRNIDNVRGDAMMIIHNDKHGKYRPDLAQGELSKEGQEQMPGSPLHERRNRDRERQAGRV